MCPTAMLGTWGPSPGSIQHRGALKLSPPTGSLQAQAGLGRGSAARVSAVVIPEASSSGTSLKRESPWPGSSAVSAWLRSRFCAQGGGSLCQCMPAAPGFVGQTPCPCPEPEQGQSHGCRDAARPCSAAHRSGDAGSTWCSDTVSQCAVFTGAVLTFPAVVYMGQFGGFGAVLGVCADNGVNTGMFSLSLSSTCTASRPFPPHATPPLSRLGVHKDLRGRSWDT